MYFSIYTVDIGFGFRNWKSSDPKIIEIKPYFLENFSRKKGSRKV